MKNVKIAELKAHLSDILQHVRGGGEVTVFDRKTPIATLEPYRAKSLIPMARAAKSRARLQPKAVVHLKPEIDAIALLRADRDAR